MKKFIKDTYLFNQLGGCPQEQSYQNFMGGLELIEEETKEMEQSFMNFYNNGQEWTNDNKAEFLDSLVDLLVVAIGAGYRVGLNRQQIELAISVVAQQNLNKFCTTREDAEKSVQQYKGDERYSNVHMERLDVDDQKYYAVIGETEKGTRKILKGINHSDPKEKIKDFV